jgi:hypothetical protein
MEPIVNTPGQTGSYQLARWVSTDKRASGDRWHAGEKPTYLELLGLPMIPLKTQYRARPPDMSNTAPVLNELAAEQSHNIIPATSVTNPRRFSGLAVTMVFTTSGPIFE